MIDLSTLPPWPCCGGHGVHTRSCVHNPANLHYCPTCDVYDLRAHRHVPLTLVAGAAFVLVVACPLILLYLFLTGLPR